MNHKGFTLIEVLASVAILGLGILSAIRLFSGSLGLARASTDSTAKVLFAKEKIKEILLEEKITEGVTKGSSDVFDWVLNVADFDSPISQKSARLLKIDLSVSSSSGATIRITTLKTASRQN